MSPAGRAPRTSRGFVLGQLLVLAGSIALGWHLDRLTRWQQVGIWLALVGVAGLLIHLRGGRSAVGPILFYDLIRSARRGRQALLRTVYLLALLGMLFLLYLNWFGGSGWSGRPAATAPIKSVPITVWWDPEPDPFRQTSDWTGRALSPVQMAQFAEAFFVTFIKVQFVVLVLITPACVAGAIAEEKERKTLEFLLATELSAREIVLGKTVSRLLYLALVLLTGLPVLGLVQLLGGVDPQMVLQGFAITGLTVLGLSGVSILLSVLVARPRTAILMSYGAAALYYLFATVTHELTGGKELGSNLLNAGNVLAGLDLFDSTAPARVPPALGDRVFLRDYALFHSGLALVCVALALVLLRPLANWQASRKSRRSFRITFMPRRRPRVGSDPMLWKELHAEPLFRLGRSAMAVVGSLFYGLGILGFCAFVLLFFLGMITDNLARTMNIGVRLLGTPLACLTLLGVAVRAATSISAERDRQTLDSLLSSPLRSAAIVKAKWLGSLLSVRRLAWLLLATWTIGLLTGGLSPLAFVLLPIAWLTYAAFLTSLGLTFSLFCKTATRATLWTLVTIVGLCVGPSLFGTCCSPLLFLYGEPTYYGRSYYVGPARRGPSTGVLVWDFQTYGLTPPLALMMLSFTGKELGSTDHWNYQGYDVSYYDEPKAFEPHVTWSRLAAVVFGLGLYGGAALVLVAVTWSSFTAKTGRMPQQVRVIRTHRLLTRPESGG